MSNPAAEDLALAEWIDDVADRFEAAWKALTPPPLEQFLGETTGERRAALLAELLKIDRAYRGRVGAPACTPAVRGLLADTGVSPQTPLAGPEPSADDRPWPDLPGYEILGEVGRGGMGVVYRARQKGLSRLVAIKMLHAGADAGGRLQHRFLAEAEAVARLQHPNIVQIHEVGGHEGRPFLTLEHVEGGSLAQRLAGQPLPAPTAARLVETLARAIHFAHERGIAHRDLKPSNVLLAGSPGLPLEQCVPKVSDFGLAKELGGAEATFQTRTGEIVGTPGYMAPEQALGKVKEVGPPTDVYALGAILYELLTGRPPFQGATVLDTLEQVRSDEPLSLRRLQPKVPRDLETVCLKCLAKSPGRRYAAARDLADDLQRFQSGEPIRARPVGRPEKVWRWCRRNPAVAALTMAVLLLLVGLTTASVGVAVTARAREDEARRREQEATGRERDRRRETLVQQVQLLRSGEHREGWSKEAWSRVEEAVRLGGEDSEGRLRNEAASTLAGLDGLLIKHFHSRNPYEQDATWVAFSPDGKRLLLGGANAGRGQAPRPARLWDRETDIVHTSRQVGPGPVVFRHDGTPLQMVPGDSPVSLMVWDVARQRQVGECRFADLPPLAALLRNDLKLPVAAVSADGNLVAAAGAAGRGVTAVWEVASGKRLVQVAAAPHALALAADGSLLAAGDRQGHLTVWSVPEGKPLAAFRERLTVWSLAFSPDGRRLACGTEGGGLTVWDWRAQRALCHCRGSGYDVTAVEFSPDGSLLASRSLYALMLWDAATGARLLSLAASEYGAGVAFAPDGRTLVNSSVTTFGPGGVHIHAVENGRGISTLHGLASDVISVTASRDGRLLAALAQDWQVAIWDVATGELRRVLDVPLGLTADNAALAFSPDGRRLAFAGGSAASLWEIATGKELRRWQLPPALTDALAFDATGGRLLLFRYETEGGKEPPYGGTHPRRHPRVCRIRDLLGAEPVKPLAESRAFDWHIFWSRADPDGRRFFAVGLHGDGGTHRSVKAFAALTGEELWSLSADRASGVTGGLDPSGGLLAVALGNTGMTVVETASGKEVAAVPDGICVLGPEARYYGVRHHHPNSSVALHRRGELAPLVRLHRRVQITSQRSPFSPDGRFMTWGNADGTVCVFDLKEVQSRLAEVGLGW